MVTTFLYFCLYWTDMKEKCSNMCPHILRILILNCKFVYFQQKTDTWWCICSSCKFSWDWCHKPNYSWCCWQEIHRLWSQTEGIYIDFNNNHNTESLRYVALMQCRVCEMSKCHFLLNSKLTFFLALAHCTFSLDRKYNVPKFPV